MRYLRIIIVVIFSILIFSCKKEEDQNPPTIEVTNPQKNTWYDTFDTIFVNAILKDDQNLIFASVELQNADLVTVTKPISKTLNTTEHRMNEAIVIDNIHLQSGKHYLLITGSDKNNTTRSFTELNVNGLPLVTKGYMVFESTGDQVRLHNYYLWNDSIHWELPGPFKDGLIDNYYQQSGYLLGPEGTFFGNPLIPLFEPWELPPDQGGITFCNAQPDYAGIQIGYKNGILAVFIQDGNLRKTYQSETTYFPALSLINENNVIVWQVQESQAQNKIEVFFIDGTIKQISPFNKTMVNMVNKSSAEIYIGANENGDGYLFDYGLASGVFNTIYELTDEPIVALCKGETGQVYFSTSEGIYQYDANQANPIIPSPFSDVKAINMEWDMVNNVLVVITQNQRIILSSFGEVLQTRFLQGNPEKLLIWYSK